MTPPLLPRSPRSILLVRLSARGDLVFAMPLIRVLRRAYPEASISWLTEAPAADLVRHHPDLAQVIVWDRAEWGALLRGGRILELFRRVAAFLRELRCPRFDVALDLHGLLRSGAVTWLSGAPVRVGLGSKEGSRIFMTRVLARDPGDARTAGSEYALMAERLELQVGDFALDVHLAAGSEERAHEIVEGVGLSGPFAVAAPFTTRPFKHWPEERWGPLLERIAAAQALPVVLLGGPGDRAAADRILSAATGPVRDLVGRTSLAEAAALVRASDLVVGVDTALTHLGSAFARPTVALFGAFVPYSVPPAPSTRVLFANQDAEPLDCQPCAGRTTCNGEWTCMRRLSEELVLSAVAEVRGAQTTWG